VEGLVDRMGVMGIGGESGFVDGGEHEAGLAEGRPKVEFQVAEGPARDGDPASWIHVANAGALYCGAIHGGAKFCIAPAGGCTFQRNAACPYFKATPTVLYLSFSHTLFKLTINKMHAILCGGYTSPLATSGIQK
jgi:hypothetical protein